MIEPATAESESPSESDVAGERWAFLRKHGRMLLYGYAIVLLLVISVQAACLFFLWRPPQDWVSFTARFTTSPAFAGVFAVLAAWIGARQLSKQLGHTKKKAADEAWWQQFEWVTDRVVSPEGKDEKHSPKLPTKLAFDLMTSLADIADGTFQKGVVGGILDHYLRDFPKQPDGAGDPEENEQTNQPDEQVKRSLREGPSMDASAAKSLRNLIAHLPESDASTDSAVRALSAYYIEEVAKALRHRGFDVERDVLRRKGAANVSVNMIATRDSKKAVINVRHSLASPTDARRASFMLKKMMEIEHTPYGLIVTPPSAAARMLTEDLSRIGVQIVQWEPSMKSFDLLRQVDLVLGGSRA